MTDSTPAGIIGNSASVAERFGTRSNINRLTALKIRDVTCVNTSSGLLYLQIHEIPNLIVTVSGAGTSAINQNFTLQTSAISGSTVTPILINGKPNWTSADTNYSIQWTGTQWIISNPAGNTVYYINLNQEAPWMGNWTVGASGTGSVPKVGPPFATAPADSAVPLVSFPVQQGLGGTLGRFLDATNVYCCWSSTEGTKTIAAASGPIQILLR